jgi:Uri superfamily endonuclease
MAMDLPETKGTYVLIALVTRMKRMEIGGLGACDLMPGYYAYVGSAFGARRTPRSHWSPPGVHGHPAQAH